MNVTTPTGQRTFRRLSLPGALGAVALVGLMSACTPAPHPGQVNDPYEANNRAAHTMNIALDRAIIKPASQVYGKALPAPVRNGVSNFASNLGLPSDIMNDLLQGNLHDTVQNTFRFILNTTVGVGGLIDVASAAGIEEKSNDFGKTLYKWGAPQGAYLVLPLLGPSSERALAGKVVDAVTNPLNFALTSSENNFVLGAKVASKIGDRYRFSATIDSILYNSPDSYKQMRLMYLQNRRYQLGQKSPQADTDPYEDPYDN